jgi:hypothetical protein
MAWLAGSHLNSSLVVTMMMAAPNDGNRSRERLAPVVVSASIAVAGLLLEPQEVAGCSSRS